MSDPLPTQLRVHRAIAEIPREAWDALLEPSSVPFLEWTFLEALEHSRSIGPHEGWHPRHLTLWRGKRLVAAAPAYLKDDSHGEFVWDWSWATAAERLGFAYYPKLILAVPMTPVTGQRILVAPGEDRRARELELCRAALDYARGEGLSSVHVTFATDPEIDSLEGAGFARRLGVQYHWVNEGYRTWEDFLARFAAKRRNQINREREQIARAGITVHTLRGEDLRSVDPADVFALYGSTLDKHPFGRRSLTQALFARLLERFRHRIEWVEARARDGRLLAGAFNLASPTTLYGRYWGALEPVPFLHFEVCLYHSVEQCIARRAPRFEPGAGGEHKLARGFGPQLTQSAHWVFHAQLDRAIREFLLHERAAIQQGMPAWKKEMGFKRTGKLR